MTHEIHGFCSPNESGSLDLADVLRESIKERSIGSTRSSVNNGEESDIDKEESARKVNQWRIRSDKNLTRNVGFYFNDGSLTGDEILRQFFH